MATALVTGIYGQDGSLLAELLLGRGYRVAGVVRPGATPPDAERAELARRCEIVEVDLAKMGDWAKDLVGSFEPDEVYHLAAAHHSSARQDDAAEQERMVQVNEAAAIALARAVVARGRGSLVVAGSSQMYRASSPPQRVDERTPHDPSTFYGVTKAKALSAIRVLREQQGLRGSCAILFNHESARRTPEFASRKITRAAARIAAGLDRSLELHDVSRRVDFSSAHDVVVALHAMATAAQPDDRVVASGELRSIAELCEVAFAAVGLRWEEHVRSLEPAGERPALVGNPSRIERELGWQRSRSFAAWVQEMVELDRRATRS